MWQGAHLFGAVERARRSVSKSSVARLRDGRGVFRWAGRLAHSRRYELLGIRPRMRLKRAARPRACTVRRVHAPSASTTRAHKCSVHAHISSMLVSRCPSRTFCRALSITEGALRLRRRRDLNCPCRSRYLCRGIFPWCRQHRCVCWSSGHRRCVSWGRCWRVRLHRCWSVNRCVRRCVSHALTGRSDFRSFGHGRGVHQVQEWVDEGIG